MFLTCPEHIAAGCKLCGGTGYLSRDGFVVLTAHVLDANSVFMGGPSQQSRRRAEDIADLLIATGVEFTGTF